MLDKINQDLISSLKSKDELKATVLRSLKTSLSNEAIAKKKKDEGLNDEESLAVLKKEAKKRKDAAQAFKDGGRPEQAETELKELAIIEEYLPEQLSAEQLKEIAEGVIREMGDVTVQDFGKVMGAVMKKVGSQADGTMVSGVVKQLLS